MNLRLPLAALLSITLLGACASSPQPIADDVMARIKTVSVVSVTASEFSRQYVGVTAFGNELDKISVADWAVDAAYEDQLASAAEKVLGAKVLRVSYPRSDFDHVNDLIGPYDAPAFWGPHWDEIEAPSKALCAANALDALLVVARGKAGDIFGGTNQRLYGAGTYARGKVSLMHLLSTIALIDCKTGKTLATKNLSKFAEDPAGGKRMMPPMERVPEEISRTPVAQWPSETKAEVRRTLVRLPSQAWEETLRTMLRPK